MKTLILFLFLSFLINDDIAQDESPKFDFEHLKKMEIDDCEEFKSNEGQIRWDEFQKIKHIFPKSEMVIDSSGKILTFTGGTVNMLMTKNQLTQLIGAPNIKPGIYLLGNDENDYRVNFTFGDYYEVLGNIFTNCKKYRQ